MRIDRLSFPELNPVRTTVLDALTALSSNVVLARKVLALSARQDDELAANRLLREAPTRPALERYTGVLYEALDYPSLPPAARRRADSRLVVASALFGALRPRDAIPSYRLSGGVCLPGLGSLRRLWRSVLPATLAVPGTVLDLRSAAYQALAPVPGAITVRVVSVRPDGRRMVVSHHNKSHKGMLARAMCTTTSRLTGPGSVLAAAEEAGLRVSRTGSSSLELLA